MNTKRIWVSSLDRRAVVRERVDFYAVELSNDARYLHRICNVSADGLLMEDRLSIQKPGNRMELELPRPDGDPLRVTAEVVRVTPEGQLGLRTLGGAPLDGIGGRIDL